MKTKVEISPEYMVAMPIYLCDGCCKTLPAGDLYYVNDPKEIRSLINEFEFLLSGEGYFCTRYITDYQYSLDKWDITIPYGPSLLDVVKSKLRDLATLGLKRVDNIQLSMID